MHILFFISLDQNDNIIFYINKLNFQVMFKIRFISMLVLLAAVATGAVAQTTYAITVKGGTEDATSWQGKAGEGEYQALPLTGLEAGTAVSVKYNGTKKVKSVKAKAYKMAAAATSADKGKLICTFGHIHAYGADAACTAARVAKIIYVGPTGHATYNHGLALALTDESSSKISWQAAIDACSAKNTSTPVTDATWLLASKDQWDYMLGANGAGSYTALRDGFSSVGGSNMQSGLYWSSTEYLFDEDEYDEVWCYVFNDGHWDYNHKDNYYRARACLAFLAQETVTLNHSANNTWAIAEMPAGGVELEVEYFNITVPTANTAYIYAGSTTPLINAGSNTEDGATMKYLVTATNEQPTSTDGFSADVPTAEGRTAGTYYVWYYLDLDSGDDSDISALAVEVTVKAVHVTMKEGTEDADNWQGKAGEGEYQALPLTGLEAGTEVSVKYNGTKKVKSVKAKAYKMAAAATSADKGKLICTSGHIHAYGEDAECTAARVAKIIYIGPTGHATYNHGLALALTDEASTMIAWQAAINACSAKNTSTPVTDATWLLASKDQWDYMLGADGAGSYTALRDGFSSVGGSNLQPKRYWSNTLDVSSGSWWYYYFGDGKWLYAPRDWVVNMVRACLVFGALGSDPDPIDLTPSADGTVWSTMPEYDVKLEVTYYTDAELDQMAADEVIAKITAIGTVTYTPESKALIDAARTAYDALTAAQQALVTNYSTLTDAETTYAAAEETAWTEVVERNPDGTWTLAATPAFDVELEVEYETALALSETTDNSAALTEWNGYEADVTLTRTLQAGSWNTFAAPFSTVIPSGWTVKPIHYSW